MYPLLGTRHQTFAPRGQELGKPEEFFPRTISIAEYLVRMGRPNAPDSSRRNMV